MNDDAIEKRLGRTRKLFRVVGRSIDLTNPAVIPHRLDAIHQAIYLLFNEGYHGSNAESTVREELCFEAIHLTDLLSEHPAGDQPKTHALLALLCLHAARLSGRMDDSGALLQLELQDRSRWNGEWIGRGFAALERSASGSELTAFHLEAAIASLHCAAGSYDATDWEQILDLYDSLYRMKPTPVIALNRAVAVGKARGPEEGLAALAKIGNTERLHDYPFYPAALGEFHLLAGRAGEARPYFEKAASLARSRTEAAFFAQRAESCRMA